MAAPKGMVITQPEKGVTEGSIEEKFTPNKTREAFLDVVGISSKDAGPWEHGVTASGMVYSHYQNKLYWHGSSARGSAGLKKSVLVAPNRKSVARIQTIWTDGNHAYWRVDENKR